MGQMLGILGLGPRDILHDKEAREEGIDLDLDADELIASIVDHPCALRRPIVVVDGKAVFGREPRRMSWIFSRERHQLA